MTYHAVKLQRHGGYDKEGLLIHTFNHDMLEWTWHLYHCCMNKSDYPVHDYVLWDIIPLVGYGLSPATEARVIPSLLICVLLSQLGVNIHNIQVRNTHILLHSHTFSRSRLELSVGSSIRSKSGHISQVDITCAMRDLTACHERIWQEHCDWQYWLIAVVVIDSGTWLLSHKAVFMWSVAFSLLPLPAIRLSSHWIRLSNWCVSWMGFIHLAVVTFNSNYCNSRHLSWRLHVAAMAREIDSFCGISSELIASILWKSHQRSS